MTQLIMLYCSLVNGTILLLSYDDEDETNPERVSLGPSFSYLYYFPGPGLDRQVIEVVLDLSLSSFLQWL